MSNRYLPCFSHLRLGSLYCSNGLQYGKIPSKQGLERLLRPCRPLLLRYGAANAGFTFRTSLHRKEVVKTAIDGGVTRENSGNQEGVVVPCGACSGDSRRIQSAGLLGFVCQKPKQIHFLPSVMWICRPKNFVLCYFFWFRTGFFLTIGCLFGNIRVEDEHSGRVPVGFYGEVDRYGRIYRQN